MKKVRKQAVKYGLILAGNLFIAVGAVFFIVPAGFITGGVTGLALALEEFLGLPISVGIGVFSMGLFLVGWAFMGREFAVNTLVSTVSYPLWVALCERVSERVSFTTDSIVLNLAGAILFFGYGVALVIQQGASSGGVDIISVILHRYRGISMALTINLFEILTMLTQVSYSTVEQIMGGVLVTLAYTAVLNNLLANDVARIQVQIISPKYEQVSHMIQHTLERGCTLLQAQGGYTRQDTFVVQTVVSSRELFRLKGAIREIDPRAFVTVSRVTEVSGLGFTYEEEAQPPQ